MWPPGKELFHPALEERPIRMRWTSSILCVVLPASTPCVHLSGQASASLATRAATVQIDSFLRLLTITVTRLLTDKGAAA
jgi:hypothetical protein